MKHERLVSRFRNREYRQGYFESHFDTSIAAQIKANREARGMSQKQLAKDARLFQSQISKFEDVNYSSWTVKSLRKIARALDLVLTIRFDRYSRAMEIRDEFPGNLVQPSFNDDDLPASKPPKTIGSLVQLRQHDAPALLTSLSMPVGPEEALLSGHYIVDPRIFGNLTVSAGTTADHTIGGTA